MYMTISKNLAALILLYLYLLKASEIKHATKHINWPRIFLLYPDQWEIKIKIAGSLNGVMILVLECNESNEILKRNTL
jgi:hypothetical protein